jgi:chitinase
MKKAKKPTHTYEDSGEYTVTLTVTNDVGETDSETTTAEIGEGNLPPVADAGGPYGGTVGEKVEFDGSGSNDPDGNIKSYKWDLGDGDSESGKTPDHKYEEPGTYTLTLKVADNDSAKASDETTVVIVEGNLPPVADAGGPYEGTVDERVEFDGSGSNDPDGNIRSYEWTFGDGGSESGETPDYKYEEPGTYTVMLTVEDNNGAKTSDETTAVISN